MDPKFDSIFSRVVVGTWTLLKMFSCLSDADEIEGKDSMMVCCGGTTELGFGFWNSATRLLMARIFPKQRVMIWPHAELLGRSMSVKMAFRRAGNR